MAEQILHECGIALLRLRKPLQYYIDKYGTPMYAANKVYLLMEKQHNRGQDGVGVANLKMNTPPGTQYIARHRSVENQPIADVFRKINKSYRKAYKENPERYLDAEYIDERVDFAGPIWLGHLRYATHGNNGVEFCHPRIRQNNWRSRNLMVAGNFNMTNTDQLFEKLVEIGQNPREKSDTVTVLEKIGHFLDDEHKRHHEYFKSQVRYDGLTARVEENIQIEPVLRRAFRDFDGGYAIAGVVGHGVSFVVRDPNGIRPCYYYADDEIIVVTSERPAIKTAFNIDYNLIKELGPGNALIIDTDSEYREVNLMPVAEKLSCSFERIYFSRGTDPDIYNERIKLGELLAIRTLEAIDNDIENTVFSYIPNTSETAFLGMLKGVENHLIKRRINEIASGKLSTEQIERLLSLKPRVEKLVTKDAKLRTFITDNEHRDDLVAHVYDVTYEVINKNKDTLVIVDDSIVRGTTLERSILTMLNRLEPGKVVIVSSAPQIRYPDCYGIDMSRIDEFIAFRAALKLLEETNQTHILNDTLKLCQQAMDDKVNEVNYVKNIYAPFTDEQISDCIGRLVKPSNMKAELKIIFQTVDDLHQATPNHLGDWYFTGNYPTIGGNKVANRAFINFMEGKQGRSY